MSDPTESNLFLHGSHVSDVTVSFYAFYNCPACGAQLEGDVEATVDELGTTSFNIDCPSCDEKDLLVEQSLVRRDSVEVDDEEPV